MTHPAETAVAAQQFATVTLSVNGQSVQRSVPVRLLLSDFLRHDLGLTGTRVGCEQGICGACTVLLNGEPVRSCLLFAVQGQGQRIETVESLTAPDGTLGTLQQAFWDEGALQCGFCTSGFLMTAAFLLRERPAPSADEVRQGLSGNLCRCTGYTPIIRAVLLAAGRNALSGGAP